MSILTWIMQYPFDFFITGLAIMIFIYLITAPFDKIATQLWYRNQMKFVEMAHLYGDEEDKKKARDIMKGR